MQQPTCELQHFRYKALDDESQSAILTAQNEIAKLSASSSFILFPSFSSLDQLFLDTALQ